MLTEPRLGTICLSKGAATPHETPAETGDPFPSDATTHCVFTNTQNDVLATVVGMVYPTKVQYLFQPTDVDAVPRGARFEMFLVTSDGTTYKIKYGRVVRREASSFNLAPADVAALNTSDVFSVRTGQPGNRYSHVYGNSTIHSNSSTSEPNGLGVDIGLLYSQSAIRVNQEADPGSDNVRFKSTVVDIGQGKTRLIVCANTNFSDYFGFELNSNNHQCRPFIGSAPMTIQYVTGEADDTARTGDYYVIEYDETTDEFAITKNAATSPLLVWPDTDNLVVHGQGYRYPGWAWDSSLLSTGPQIQSWELL